MSEQGHAKNLEHFKSGRTFATSWQAKYAPTNPLLLLTNFDSIISAAEPALDAVTVAKTPYRNATAAAHDAFKPLSELITRVMSALKVSGVPDSVVEDAKTYARKIKGQSKSPKPKDDPNSPNFDESARANSSSQMSRTQRIENLDALISLLESQPLYKPNEADLRTAALADLSADLKAKTAAVQETFVPLSNALAARDGIFYANKTGLVAVGRLFKEYVESFGRKSPERMQVKGLVFKEIKRK
jgi:hypothetical protein